MVDLLVFGIGEGKVVARERERVVEVDREDQVVVPEVFAHDQVGHAENQIRVGRVHEIVDLLALREIGRASCRERVCQSVYIWGVAVCIKQHKHYKYTKCSTKLNT